MEVKRSWNKGQYNPKSKLTEEKVRNIRKMIEEGNSLASISRWYGVGTTAIYKIKIGENWKHVT